MKVEKEVEFIPYQVFLETYQIDRSTGDRMRKAGLITIYRFGGGNKLYVKNSEIHNFFKKDVEVI